MKSIWKQTVQLPAFSSLKQDLQTDVAVIGGGMAGLLTAYMLKQQGLRAVVLEADTVASGQTENTTAKLTAQHGLIYHKLIETLGEETAKQYAEANQKAIEEYRRIIEEKKIDCDFVTCPAYLYSLEEASPLQQEAEAAKRLGIPASFTTETELPFPVKGAVRFENQARFHPLAFLQGILPELTVYEHTEVQAVKGNQVVTAQGIVTANHVVFTTHYPFPLSPGYYFMRMHQERSYVLALKNAMELEGMYLGIDQQNSWSLRCAQGLLLFGGGNHRTGENRPGGKYRMLRQKADELWPHHVEEAHWSAQDCMLLDSMPYIGTFAPSEPNWFVATGFQKWGMTTSMVSAVAITDLILGREHPYPAFSPQRFTPEASAKQFLEDGLHAVRDLSRRIFAPSRGAVEALPLGHGGVVDCDGEKLGVYKDEQGELYVVSVKCPHLGCQLEWNPDEKSWDCPCHGSRFDYQGHLLDNPAQTNLRRPEI